MNTRRQGFSLLETGVVIGVVGLVAGAILTSQELSRRSELRAVITDATTYSIAAQNFQKKYAAMPGDIPNATSFWGRADLGVSGNMTSLVTQNCSEPATTQSNGDKTCNGNGDGIVGGAGDLLGEQYRAWQHLSAGDYLTATFTGTKERADGPGATAVSNTAPGENVPAGKLTNSGYSLRSEGEFTGNANATYFDGNYNNAMFFGAPKVGDDTVNPSLKTQEAREIDEKTDDMSPATGAIRSIKNGAGSTPSCVATDGKYNEMNRDLSCALIFMNTYQKKNGY